MPRDEVSWPCFSYKEGKELALISFRSAVVLFLSSGHRAGEGTRWGPSSASKPGPSPVPPGKRGWRLGHIPDTFLGNPAKIFYFTCVHFILVLKDTIILYLLLVNI